MTDYEGVIIEESLENRTVLGMVEIVSTKVEEVTPEHRTLWLSRWTLHTVRVPETEAQAIAEEVGRSLDESHEGSWYADFKNDTHHYIIFRNRIFHIGRTDAAGYDEAKRYGIALGIPEHQVDFHPDVEQWER